jgi:ribosomal protein S18 acetylase RimI-like enzyme
MIARLGREHVKDVARLHRQNLTGLLTNLGLSAIRAFYAGCVKTSSAIGFVYLEDGELLGFVLGSPRPDKLKMEALRQNPVDTLVGMSVGIVRRPSSLVWLMKSFGGPDEGSFSASVPELTYLAVAGESRGAGIGSQLVDAFTDAMRHSGAVAYELSVDENNQQAISFYERLGFVLSSRYREFGVWHRRYRLEIDLGGP